jgi:hypothetical protein
LIAAFLDRASSCHHDGFITTLMHPLLGRIEKGEIDPSFVIPHRATLAEAAGT